MANHTKARRQAQERYRQAEFNKSSNTPLLIINNRKMNSPQLNRQYHEVHRKFISELNRSKDLFDRLVVHGGTDQNANWRRLRVTDRRDIVQFLFFECASQWEFFAKQSLTLAIRDSYRISAQKADYVIGTPDQGLSRIMGWGDPKILKERSANFLGVNSEIARLNAIPGHGQNPYNRLSWSHKIRNRIEHVGQNNQYIAILNALGVPPNQRQGLGPARLLMDYPIAQPPNNRWFHQFLNNYESIADRWLANL